MKNAFTMIELVFIIVIIGILSAVAVPKLAPIVGNAKDTKAKATLASVRSALSTERQKRILSGKFTPITALGDSTNVFGHFYDEDGKTDTSVLEYPIASKKKAHHWYFYGSGGWYAYCLNDTCNNPGAIWFKLEKNRFNCIKHSSYGDCSLLE